MDVAEVVARLGETRQGVVGWPELRAAGVSRSQLSRAVSAGRVQRSGRSTYGTAPLPAWPRHLVTDAGPSPAYVARVRAVLHVLGPGAAACGRTAAVLRGWGLLVEPGRTLEVAVPHGRSRAHAAGARLRRRRGAHVVSHRPVPGSAALRLTGAVQTALDCALELPLLQAVVAVDSALRSGQVELAELTNAVARLPGVAAAVRARRALALCDPLSGSVLESVYRVRAALAGLPEAVTQKVLCDLPGQHLRVDFAYLEAGLVVEVDGARWHQDPARDQARDNLLAALGWRVLRFTWVEVVHQPEAVLATVQAALAAATPGTHLSSDLVDLAA